MVSISFPLWTGAAVRAWNTIINRLEANGLKAFAENSTCFVLIMPESDSLNAFVWLINVRFAICSQCGSGSARLATRKRNTTYSS